MHTNPRKIMTKDTTELNKKSMKSGGIDYDVFIHENSIIYSYTFTDDYKEMCIRDRDMEKPRFGASEPWRLLPIGKVLDIPLRNGPPPGYVR